MIKRVLTGAIIAACLAFAAYPWLGEYVYARRADKIESTISVRVTWKERISYGEIYQKHYYLIYGEAENGEPCVLQNSDSPQRGKYNGSDIYQQIDPGRVYTFFTTGERNPKYARYPNIIYIVGESADWEGSIYDGQNSGGA